MKHKINEKNEKNEIYQAFGLAKEQVETEENDKQLQCFLKINNMNK